MTKGSFGSRLRIFPDVYIHMLAILEREMWIKKVKMQRRIDREKKRKKG